MQVRRKFLQATKAGKSRTYGASGSSGLAPTRARTSVDALWERYFKDPTEWWDNRGNKLHPKSPDFRHKNAKHALWLHHWKTPQWVMQALKTTTLQINTGTDSLDCCSGFYDVSRHAVNLKATRRDVYFWTELALQHTNSGQLRQALRVYEEMRKEGVEPSRHIFVSLLKACIILQDLATAKQIHDEVIKMGLQADLYVATMLVNVYAKCKSLVDARHAFDNMPLRDVVSWNAMILGYAQMDKGEEALQLYSQLLEEGVVPDSRTYVSALKACSSLAQSADRKEREGIGVKERCMATVTAIHTDLLHRKFELGVILGTMLVDAYAKCGSLEDARQVFEQMPHRDVVSWNAMILGYSESEEGADSLQLYNRMKEEHVMPDSRTYVAALKACSRLVESASKNDGESLDTLEKCLETVKAIHRDSIQQNFESDLFVATMLVDVYAKCGSLEDARRVFEEMPARSVVTWNAMILGYAQMANGNEALHLHTRMQDEGVVPNDQTNVAALKACITLARSGEPDECDGIALRQRCLETVKTIHAHVVKQGSSDDSLGTALVDAYAKCGSLEDARRVFAEMPQQTVGSWNAMILAHAQMDKCQEALQFYTQMQQEDVIPNQRTYVTALKACGAMLELKGRSPGDAVAAKEKCLETVRSIHTDILVRKVQMDVFVGTMLLDVYAKCGSLEDAKHVFDKMSDRTVVSWNTMIFGYAQMDKGKEALKLYAQMRQEGVPPNGRTYVGALKACSALAESVDPTEIDSLVVKERWLKKVKAIHSDIVKQRFDLDVFVGNMLVDAYAKCGGLENARRVFEQMPRRDVVSWNAMILGCVQMDKGEEALQLYKRMQTEGVVPDGWTFVSALRASSSLADLEDGNAGDGIGAKEQTLGTVRSIHKDILKLKVELDVFVGSMLVDVYSKCGTLKDARHVFDQMTERTVVVWNAMILGYAQSNECEEALQLFAQMRDEGVMPDGRTYAIALKACSVLAELSDRNEGNDLDALKERCLETVRVIHEDIEKENFESDAFIETTLVDVYAKCGNLEDARCVFDKMRQHDVVSWTAMILGYSQMGRGEEALKLFTRMQQEGVIPDSRTYVAALNACGSLAGLEKGKEIHSEVLKAGLEGVDSFVTESLINMYGKCGSMADALQVFEAMAKREIVAWNALISGYAHQGDSQAVFDMFDRMVKEGVHPDRITFLGVLTVCSHAGLVDRGQEYLNAMSTVYGMVPTIKHVTCVVDLLGRAGHLAEAMEMVKALHLQPCGALWRCLLGACRKWGDVELGRQAFESAVRLNKDDAAAYVLMSNIYAAAHMWEEANEMQTVRVQSGAWKQPGQSWWMDMSGAVHVFVVGDQRHPESQDIYAKLKDLLVKMKKQGYVPHLDSVLRDIPDDEKEDALCGHSERLAICYALLKTPEGTTIRVVKNLRVCEDCHRATALISRIEQRTIICRDATRFHVFKDGKCSCGDYW